MKLQTAEVKNILSILMWTCRQTERNGGGIHASSLTDRKFVVDVTYPCKMEQLWIPNEYNWLECKDYALSVPDNEVEEFRWYGQIQRRLLLI